MKIPFGQSDLAWHSLQQNALRQDTMRHAGVGTRKQRDGLEPGDIIDPQPSLARWIAGSRPGGGDQGGRAASLGDRDLAKLSDSDLANQFAANRWDDSSIKKFKKEYERRAGEVGGIDKVERKVIDELVARAGRGKLGKEDTAKLFAVTGTTSDLLQAVLDDRAKWTPEQRKVIVNEIARRARNDVAGYQPWEENSLKKLRDGGTLTDDERLALTRSMPTNAGDRKSSQEVYFETTASVKDGVYYGDLDSLQAEVVASIARKEYRDILSADGKLTKEEEAAIDGYTNAIKELKKDAGKEWERLKKLLPE